MKRDNLDASALSSIRVIDVKIQYGYYGVMNTANISYTRNHLSELLDRVREGETVLIVDRDQPVARLQPVGQSDSDGPEWQAGLIRKGLIRSAAHRLDAKAFRAMPMPQSQKKGDVLAALLADRDSDR